MKIHTNTNAMGKRLTPGITDHPIHRFHLKQTASSNSEVHRNLKKTEKVIANLPYLRYILQR